MFKKIFLSALVVGATISCSRDNDNPAPNVAISTNDPSVGVQGTYVITVTGSQDVVIGAIGVNTDEGEQGFTPMTSSWSKQFTSKTIKVGIGARGSSANSKINVKLTKDGKLVKEANASGISLGISIEH